MHRSMTVALALTAGLVGQAAADSRVTLSQVLQSHQAQAERERAERLAREQEARRARREGWDAAMARARTYVRNLRATHERELGAVRSELAQARSQAARAEARGRTAQVELTRSRRELSAARAQLSQLEDAQRELAAATRELEATQRLADERGRRMVRTHERIVEVAGHGALGGLLSRLVITDLEPGDDIPRPTRQALDLIECKLTACDLESDFEQDLGVDELGPQDSILISPGPEVAEAPDLDQGESPFGLPSEGLEGAASGASSARYHDGPTAAAE